MNLKERERKLKNVVREDFSKHIKPLVEVKSCKSCGSDIELSIHHVIPLSVTTQKVFDKYSKVLDIEAMRELILSQQLKQLTAGKLIVLCKSCHIIVHEVYYDYNEFDENNVEAYIKKKYLKNTEKRLVLNTGRNQRKIEINKFLKGLFLSNIIYYYKEEREDLIEMIAKITNEKDFDSSCTAVNKLLLEYSSQYIFEEFNTKVRGKSYKHAWRVIKVSNEGKTKAEKNIIKAENNSLKRKIGKSLNSYLNDSYNKKSKYYIKEMREDLLESLSEIANKDITNLSEANSMLKETKSIFRIMSSKGTVEGKHRSQVWRIKKLS